MLNYNPKIKNQIVDILNQTVTPFKSPCRLESSPIVFRTETDDFKLLFETTPILLDNDDPIFRIVKMDSHGVIEREIKEKNKPEKIQVDKKGHIFITYSLPQDRFDLYKDGFTTPRCFLKGYDENGQELYKFVTENTLNNPLVLGLKGEVYIYSNGTLYAIG